MSTAAELYAAILADPDNLELRLQYADAVADTDPEHAELIRLQLEKERLGRQARVSRLICHATNGVSPVR